jgi:hypothetical protein
MSAAEPQQTVSWLVVVLITLVPIGLTVGFYFWMKRKNRRSYGPVIGNVEAAATMSPEFVERPPRKLKEIASGEEIYISVAYIAVDEKGRTFVDLDAPTTTEPGIAAVKVKPVDGGYWLWMFKPGSLNMTFKKRQLLIGKYEAVIKIFEAE